MTTMYAQHQATAMVHANAVARRSFLVCAAPAGQWSPIPNSAIETTDRKPGRLRRTPVSTT
jgi:hypothetical protein